MGVACLEKTFADCWKFPAIRYTVYRPTTGAIFYGPIVADVHVVSCHQHSHLGVPCRGTCTNQSTNHGGRWSLLYPLYPELWPQSRCSERIMVLFGGQSSDSISSTADSKEEWPRFAHASYSKIIIMVNGSRAKTHRGQAVEAIFRWPGNEATPGEKPPL